MSDTVFAAGNPEYLRRTLPNGDGGLGVAAAELFFAESFPDIPAGEARRLRAAA